MCSPPQARYLKFCQDYNAISCCIPGHDLENQVQFENLIDALGPGCKNPLMYPEIRYFYCLGCDPKQPEYTTITGVNSDNETTSEIRVCKSFLEKLWRDPAFSECGVMKSNPCPELWGKHEMDPYMCGDNLEMPKQVYSDVVAFINAYKPPGLDAPTTTFVMVDDVANPSAACWSAPSFQSSATRLVSSSPFATLAIMATGMVLSSWL